MKQRGNLCVCVSASQFTEDQFVVERENQSLNMIKYWN